MTTIARVKWRCSVDGCPWVNDEEAHVNWCRHKNRCTTHQHWPKKGMGGHNSASKIVSLLCWECHDRCDNRDWGNAVLDIPGVGRIYRLWDGKNHTVFERVLEESDGRTNGADLADSVLLPGGHCRDDLRTSDRCAVLLAPASRPSQRVSDNFGVARKEPDLYISLPALVEHLKDLPDEELAEVSRNAHNAATNAYINHCAVVYAYRSRNRGHGWDESGASLFGYAASSLRRDAAFFDRLLCRLQAATPEEAELIEEVSDRQLRVVAQAKDFDRALDEAIAYKADTNRNEPEGLRGRLQAEGLLEKSVMTYICQSCEAEGRLGEQFRRKRE